MVALTERTKAGRGAIAIRLVEIAQRHGAAAWIETGKDQATVSIHHPSGLQCYVWLEHRPVQPDVHVIPWHIGSSYKRLAKSFGDVNPHHGRKATHIAHGWEALSAEIERGLAAAADGTAYEADEEKKS